MHRVTRRTWIVWLFLLILLGGMGFFLWEYTTQAAQWASFTGSPHIYHGAYLESGSVTDRSGQVLLNFHDGRNYASDAATRKSTLHWLGDRNRNIRSTVVNSYAAAMSGFDRVNGLYNHTQWQEEGKTVLTLSAQVQNTAMAALGKRRGTVGVYNYKTGEILCAVSSPSFDPDNVPDISSDPDGAYKGVYLNRFIQSTYPPGSIFKIVTTAAALDTVPDILDQTFTCTGTYEYGIDKVTCEKAHGKVTLKSALAHSCNCAYAQIAEQVGKSNMEQYVKKFQIMEPLSFDGFTTAAGNYDISKAAPVELAWSCIGQYTDLVNPCRYMAFMGAIAGGGRGAEPYLVSHVVSGDRETYRAKTQKSPQIMSAQVAETLQEYMHNNVQTIYGSGNFPGFQKVCGKSGTSQLGGDLTSNAMFSGFILDEDYPLAFVAVVENAGYGSANCVPVLSKVLTACKQVMDQE